MQDRRLKAVTVAAKLWSWELARSDYLEPCCFEPRALKPLCIHEQVSRRKSPKSPPCLELNLFPLTNARLTSFWKKRVRLISCTKPLVVLRLHLRSWIGSDQTECMCLRACQDGKILYCWMRKVCSEIL